MKPRVLLSLLLCLFAAYAAFCPRTARAQDEVSFEFFYDALAPYGTWIEVPEYGLCWRPSDVPEDWAPYTDGYWSYTDGGWTWVSYEDFGGIVYHYGRWTEIEEIGWVWVPGYDWGPAWVAWRSDDENIGWAPLPPEVTYTPDEGVSTWVDTTYDIGPTHYRFCRVQDFGAPVIREVCYPPAHNITIIANTVNITNISFARGGFPFCGGPRFDVIAPRCLHPIPTLLIVRNTNIVNINNTVINNRVVYQGVQRGNTIVFPAPKVRVTTNPLASPKFRPSQAFPSAKVNRGWNAVPPTQAQAIKTKFVAQTQGATPATVKAAPPAATDLAPVPTKADPTAKIPVRRAPPTTPRGPGATVSTPGGTPAVIPQPRPGTTRPLPTVRATTTPRPERRLPAATVAPATPGAEQPNVPVTPTLPGRGPGAMPNRPEPGQAPTRPQPNFPPQRVPQAQPQGPPQRVPQPMPQRSPQTDPQRVPQTMPQRLPQTVPQRSPQAQPQRVPQPMPQRVPQADPQRVPQPQVQRQPQPQPQPQRVPQPPPQRAPQPQPQPQVQRPVQPPPQPQRQPTPQTAPQPPPRPAQPQPQASPDDDKRKKR